MLKKSSLTALLMFSIISFSQEIVNSFPIVLKKDTQVFQVVNNTSKQITLFFQNQNRINAIYLDDKMNFIDSLSTAKPEKNYSKIIGSISSDNNSTLFWLSSNQKKVLSQSFDTKNIKTSEKIFPLDFKNEIYLQEFSVAGKFLILSLLKESNLFKLYVFDQQGNLDIKDLNFGAAKFNHRPTLYDTFAEDFMPFEQEFSLEKINTESPSSLSNTSKKRKCYVLNNQINITIDTDQNYTQLIQIDVENYNVTSKNILQTPFKNFGTPEVNFNSFLYDNLLYQIKSSSKKFYLTIKDLNGNLIKEYYATGDKPIDFENSWIYQDGGFTDKRILDNSSQFIRKINNLKTGISCYKVGENNLITLGGVSAEQQSVEQSVMSQFGFIGSLLGVLVFSPTIENFNSYSNRKVVKIQGLFDKDAKHIKGEIAPLAFDKMRIFFDKDKNVSSRTLFKLDTIYYFGYYDNTTKKYTIRKFND